MEKVLSVLPWKLEYILMPRAAGKVFVERNFTGRSCRKCLALFLQYENYKICQD